MTQNPNDPNHLGPDNGQDTTNEFDEFEQAQLEDRQSQPTTFMDKAKQVWRENPLVKLLAVMGGVAAMVGLVVWMTSGGERAQNAQIQKAPDLQEAPGGQATPAYNEAIREQAAKETAEALRSGESAIPTPLGRDINLDDLNSDPNANDPLREFRAEIERLKQQQDQQQQTIQKQAETPQQFNDDLQRKMEQQMTALLESWKPGSMQVVSGIKDERSAEDLNLVGARSGTITGVETDGQTLPASAVLSAQEKAIVPAGTVNYAQMLVEANSDVPGPIMAQILSGPFSGARVIGKFEYLEDYLIISFDLVNYKGRDYKIDAIALDPDTTLGGLATETDPRYFRRLILPAAAAFTAGLGSSLSSGGTSVQVTDNAVITTQAKQGLEEGLFRGMGQAATTMGQFFQREADKIKPLVRVATGTPIGLFFIKSVFPGDSNSGFGGLDGSYNGSLPPLPDGTNPAGASSALPAPGGNRMFGTPGYAPQSGYAPQIQNFPSSSAGNPALPELGSGSSIAIYPR